MDPRTAINATTVPTRIGNLKDSITTIGNHRLSAIRNLQYVAYKASITATLIC